MNQFVKEIRELNNKRVSSNFLKGITNKEKYFCSKRKVEEMKEPTFEKLKELDQYDIVCGKVVITKKDKTPSKPIYFGRCYLKNVKEYIFIPLGRNNDLCLTKDNIISMTLFLWKDQQEPLDWTEFEL